MYGAMQEHLQKTLQEIRDNGGTPLEWKIWQARKIKFTHQLGCD